MPGPAKSPPSRSRPPRRRRRSSDEPLLTAAEREIASTGRKARRALKRGDAKQAELLLRAVRAARKRAPLERKRLDEERAAAEAGARRTAELIAESTNAWPPCAASSRKTA